MEDANLGYVQTHLFLHLDVTASQKRPNQLPNDTMPQPQIKVLLMVVSKRWFKFCGEIKFPYPLLTSI